VAVGATKRMSWREKLVNDNDLPRVITLDSTKWGHGTCVVPAPREVDALMRKVKPGKLTTIRHLRRALAEKHGAAMACPITTGIFA